MGQDMNIYFPAHTPVQSVAEAMGILLGNHYERDIGINVDGVNVRVTNVPQMAEILISIANREQPVHAWWHFESDELHGERILSCRTSSPIVNIAEPLAKFFGGRVDLNDCDDVSADFVFKCPRKRNNPSDGKEWEKFWDDMMKLGKGA